MWVRVFPRRGGRVGREGGVGEEGYEGGGEEGCEGGWGRRVVGGVGSFTDWGV